MAQPRSPDEGERPESSSGRQPSRRNNAPLVIVSERGRHSDESRRIVRAQAARASAAQSRVTRARNREGRESGPRESPHSPLTSEDTQPPTSTPEASARSSYFGAITRPFGKPFASAPLQSPPQQQELPSPYQQPQPQPHRQNDSQSHFSTPSTDSSADALNVPLNLVTQKPLVNWLATLLNVSATQLFTNPYAIPSLAGYTLTGATNALTATGAFAGGAVGSLTGVVPMQDTTGGAFGRIFSTATGASQGGGGYGSAVPGSISTPGTGGHDPGALQLPRALPRGFNVLNQRIPLSDPLLGLLTRTSCFDFGSQGIEERIHGLLFDLIIGYLKAAFSPLAPSNGPPVQDHLRIACTCLTIFQGQRANGAVFAHEPTYDKGLEAAWSEVQLLDQQALSDSRSAEASLWAVFIISVTTGTKEGSFFQRVLQGLFHDLQLQYWSDVRKILLDFIYPVSFLDEPCRAFWEKVQGAGITGGAPEALPVVS